MARTSQSQQFRGSSAIMAGMSEEHSRTTPPIQDDLPNLIRMLREPAGDDPRFASLEAIEANRQAFTEKVHATWKYLHGRSLDEILAIEGILTPDRRKKLPEDFVWYLERTITLWRRVNDAIVWSLVRHQDHVIRTVCHRKERVRLTDANPKALRRFLDEINEDPLTIAIWSDATSCVDVGDVLCRSFSGKLDGFFEVKEGTMNDRILDLMGVKGTPDEIVREIVAFADKYGTKAMKQLERVAKQRHRYNQYMDIIDDDRGFDPRREAEVTILESRIELKSYDDELQAAIDVSRHAPALHCIDHCLWVYFDQNSSKTPAEKIADFERELAKTSPTTLKWFREHFGPNQPFEPVVLEGNLTCPEAIPLFLRLLQPETVRDVLIGKLMFSVFLFVDWHELGRILADFGAELAWSTAKKGRTERTKPEPKRLLTIGDRIPRVQVSDGRYLEGFSKIYRVLFEGITPTSIAAQYVEALKSGNTLNRRAAAH
ncbi:MAG TPA: hypothetical protein VGI16_01175 [Candidatus Acidoferrum sp.]|jgi:hypothetical protein